MAANIIFTNGATETVDSAHLKVTSAGVLIIKDQEKARFYSPTGWLAIEGVEPAASVYEERGVMGV